MDGLSFIQGMHFWKLLTKGFNFSKKKIILLENILQHIFKYVTKSINENIFQQNK